MTKFSATEIAQMHRDAIVRPELANDYWAGVEAKRVEIREMGLEAAWSKFLADNKGPSCSMAAWYYRKGEHNALLEAE